MIAPYFADVADDPADARALWLMTSDGVRIRAAIWNAAGPRGTVFLLPGRSEYVEKYGRNAVDLAAAGYAVLSVDWRGQGLSDRALADRAVGHVADFAEYQRDMDALILAARAQDLPSPWYLLPHSMGGCIGLRSLMRGLPFQAAAFSAPMWGISMANYLRPITQILSSAARRFGFQHRYAPSTNAQSYVLAVPFAGNVLTRDPAMWDYMAAQCRAHPDLALGGPSLGWLKAALDECRTLAALPSPAVPALCALGSAEKVIDIRPVHARMANWPQARLDMYQDAEHEVLMEVPSTRAAFTASAVKLFSAHP